MSYKKTNDTFPILGSIIARLSRPSLAKKVTFFRLMAITQKAGLGIRESLITLKKSEKHSGMRAILEDLILKINQGISLSTAFEDHLYFFNYQEIQLLKSSEAMGNLPETLNGISDELENHQRLIGKIKGALTYPTVILFASIVASIVLIVMVIPKIISLFPPGAGLPKITLFMLGVKDFIMNYRYLLIITVIFTPIGFTLSYKHFLSFKIFVDKLLIELPIVGDLVRKFNLYRFSKLLGDFYNAGVSPNLALSQIQDVIQNFHYKKKVNEIRRDIEVGLSFTESMEGSYLFDAILIQIIGVGETTGNIGEVLDKIAEFYRDEINMKIEQMMKLIEPFMMIFVAGIIGLIVTSVFLPLMDLASALTG